MRAPQSRPAGRSRGVARVVPVTLWAVLLVGEVLIAHASKSILTHTDICTYVRTYVRTYIEGEHACIHTYVHVHTLRIHTYTYIHTSNYLHTYLNTCMHAYKRTYTLRCTYWYTDNMLICTY